MHDVLVVGGGNAGISAAARLLRDGVDGVTVVESEPTHRYRPLLNYVGVGEAPMRELERDASAVVPDGCRAIRDEVVAVDPVARTVSTRDGAQHSYTTLVLATGLTEDWDATPGLREAYADGWATSTFLAETAPRVWDALGAVRDGTVVFTVPPEPAPCGATALKPLFMACDHWQRTGVLSDIDVRLVLPGESVSGLARADQRLDRVLAGYGVTVLRESRVARVDAEGHSITLTTPAGEQVVGEVSLAHVVPHYRAPRWLVDSDLSDGSPAGLVDVDPETLRHRRHPSVWSLGDVAALGIRPSGGALRKQVEVLASNVLAGEDDELSTYDGYTVMPITVDRRRLLLVEVDRDLRPTPSVPLLDLTKPRRSTWLFDRYLLPVIYYRRILRGKV